MIVHMSDHMLCTIGRNHTQSISEDDLVAAVSVPRGVKGSPKADRGTRPHSPQSVLRDCSRRYTCPEEAIQPPLI